MPILKMLTGLCGPDFSLVRGDEREFDEREASSLIRAGFAVATDGFEPIALEDDAAPVDEDAAKAAEEAAAAAKADEEAAAAKQAEAVAAAEKAKAAAAAAPAKPAPAKRKA